MVWFTRSHNEYNNCICTFLLHLAGDAILIPAGIRAMPCIAFADELASIHDNRKLAFYCMANAARVKYQPFALWTFYSSAAMQF